jgi:hypothetical protein
MSVSNGLVNRIKTTTTEEVCNSQLAEDERVSRIARFGRSKREALKQAMMK